MNQKWDKDKKDWKAKCEGKEKKGNEQIGFKNVAQKVKVIEEMVHWKEKGSRK